MSKVTIEDTSSAVCAFDEPELLATTIELSDRFSSSGKIIETGTLCGNSACILSFFFNEVHTIEKDPVYYGIAREKLSQRDNVYMHLGSSPIVLNGILIKGDSSYVIFLDAHGGAYEDDRVADAYTPILDELKIIKHKQSKPVIIIHDFFVPVEEGEEPAFKGSRFAYEDYGIPLDMNLIKPFIDDIYGENNYDFHYIQNPHLSKMKHKLVDVDSGAVFFYPKQ